LACTVALIVVGPRIISGSYVAMPVSFVCKTVYSFCSRLVRVRWIVAFGTFGVVLMIKTGFNKYSDPLGVISTFSGLGRTVMLPE
jgi:hypothetical protein